MSEQEQKWTPGPWAFSMSERQDFAEVIAPNGYVIAEFDLADAAYHSAEACETEIANAHLMAAAFDLYEALVEYLDWHEANFILASGNFEDPDQHSLARNARIALSKARGESQ